MISKPLFGALLILGLTGCRSKCCDEDICVTPTAKKQQTQQQPLKIKTISIIDRNGFSETISGTERLKQYRNIDFLKPQSYQKVLRVLYRNAQGEIPAYLTSYHTNGQVKQYIEIINSRALGDYKEWYENGNLKLEAKLVGGEADLTMAAEKTWLFDGESKAWSEEGLLLATINYDKGALHGDSVYYHKNGSVWKRVPYNNNRIHGYAELYKDNGELLNVIQYSFGKRHGPSTRYWTPDSIAAEESFDDDLLINGVYYNINGEKISEVVDGKGYRTIFGRSDIAEIHEFRNGIQEGEVKIYGSDQKPLRKFYTKNSLKHGEEIEFQDLPHLRHLPKLSVTWFENKVQGISKTWYDNGNQESKREMSNNQKNGISTAWYRDGSLMLIEEYEHDKLLKGEYFRRGEKRPISEIFSGEGTATIFDSEGNFLRKIFYNDGIPTGSTS